MLPSLHIDLSNLIPKLPKPYVPELLQGGVGSFQQGWFIEAAIIAGALTYIYAFVLTDEKKRQKWGENKIMKVSTGLAVLEIIRIMIAK